MPRIPFQISKLKLREKGWAVLWVVVILNVAYARWIHQPQAARIRANSRQIESLQRERVALRAQLQDIPKRRADVDALKEELVRIYDAFTEAEKELLDVQDVDQLLSSLVKDVQRFELILNSIRPVEQREPSVAEPTLGRSSDRAEPYRKLRIQVDAFASFEGLVRYIGFLEKMGPYQQVERVKVRIEGKEYSRPHAVLLLVALIGETLEGREAARSEIFGLLEELASRESKDPFLTGERPKETVEAVGLSLTGIFSEEGKPSAALINGEVYRVGDVVDQRRITSIEAERVLLEQGNRRFILAPHQRQAEMSE